MNAILSIYAISSIDKATFSLLTNLSKPSSMGRMKHQIEGGKSNTASGESVNTLKEEYKL